MGEWNAIKDHWNAVGGKQYRSFWKNSLAHRILSEKEERFVASFIPQKPIKALDFGSGAGRFLGVSLNRSGAGSEIYALDISENMVGYCRERFGGHPRCKGVETVREGKALCDYFGASFDRITAIRVLKYNTRWRDMLTELFGLLREDGIIIFTMPKAYLLSWFLPQKNVMRKNKEAIRRIALQHNMDVLEIKGFAKIPEFFYAFDNTICSRLVLWTEGVLRFLFGDQRFEREVFYVFRKPRSS